MSMEKCMPDFFQVVWVQFSYNDIQISRSFEYKIAKVFGIYLRAIHKRIVFQKIVIFKS